MSLMELTTKEVGKHTIQGTEYTLFADINYGFYFAEDSKGVRPVEGIFSDMEQLITAIKTEASREEDAKRKLVASYKSQIKNETRAKEKEAKAKQMAEEARKVAEKELAEEAKRTAKKTKVEDTAEEV